MQLLGTAILIKPDTLPERTKSGAVIIPKTSEELKPETGTIIQTGSMCRDIKAGDHVKFPRKSCSIIVIDNEDYYITNEYKIFYYEQRK